MSQYVDITPAGDVTATREPFRFAIGEHKFELPALDTADIPLALIPVFLVLSETGVENASEAQKLQAAAAFVTFLERENPALWRVLKSQPKPILWINGLIRQWGEHSGVDPKA